MKTDCLTVSLVQFSPRWENPQYNLSRYSDFFLLFHRNPDIIIFPEMFPTGFSMNTKKICSKQKFITQWMQYVAEVTGALVVGSVAVKENSRFYNRLYWVSADGVMGHYDKHHLFTLADEHKHYTAGTEKKQFEWRGWEIKPIVCYDLRFPEWCRNNRMKPYDLLICVANWPAVRSDAWLTLLKARALENQCFVAGVNRTGTDGNKMLYGGDTIMYSPKGETIGKIAENEETVATFELSLPGLHDFRKKFPVLNDMDD